MPKYEVKVKVSKGEFKNLKKAVKKVIDNKIGPELSGAVRKLLLYRGLKPGMSARLDTFKIANAGILSKLIIENLKLSAINLKKGSETGVQIKDTPKGSEVVMKAEIDDTAMKRYERWSPAAILKDVANLSNAETRSIVNEAFERVGFDNE